MKNLITLIFVFTLFIGLTGCSSSASTETPPEEKAVVEEYQSVNENVDKAMTELDEKSKELDQAMDDLDNLFEEEETN